MGCDTDVAWCAGFLDGEGTILLSLLAKTLQNTPGILLRRPMISASQSLTVLPLQKLQRTLGGSIVVARRKTTTGRTVWIWGAAGATAARFILPQLIPHLTVKLESAKLALAYANTMKPQGQQRKLTAEVIELRESIIARFYDLPERRKAIRRTK